MRKFVILAALLAVTATSYIPTTAHAVPNEKAIVEQYVVLQPGLPPAGVTLRGSTWVNADALTGSPMLLVFNNTDEIIDSISCKNYVIAGPGADASYHNPAHIPAHQWAIVNFGDAPRTCSHNPVVFGLESGLKVNGTPNGTSISDSTKIVATK